MLVSTASTAPPMISARTIRNGIQGNPRRAGTRTGDEVGEMRRFGLSGFMRIAEPHSRQNSCPRSTGARHSGHEPPIPTPIDEVSERGGVVTRVRRPCVAVQILDVRAPYGFLPAPSPAPSVSPGVVFLDRCVCSFLYLADHCPPPMALAIRQWRHRLQHPSDQSSEVASAPCES